MFSLFMVSSQSILNRVMRGLVCKIFRTTLSNCGLEGGFSLISGSEYSLFT